MLLKSLIIAFPVLLSFSQSAPLSACSNPNDLLSWWNSTNQQYLLNLVEDEANKLQKSVINGSDIWGDAWCPNNLNTSTELSVIKRSTCPYYYVLNVNSNRYPSSIREARCRCNKCLEPTGKSDFNVCEPFTLPIKVKRKTDCKEYTHHLQIACTCAKKREVVNGQEMASAPAPPEDDSPPPM